MNDPKFKNADGTLTAYALRCGYCETLPCHDVISAQQKHLDDLGREVTVTLWHEHDHFHVRRSDWFLLRNVHNLAAHAWDTCMTLSEARKRFDALQRGYLQIGETGTVHSSEGDFDICMATGLVIEYDGAGYLGTGRIVRFDLDEYFRHYSTENRETITEFDILDLGYWMIDGNYEAPEQDFRAHVASLSE